MRYGAATPTFAVNLVGTAIHIAKAPAAAVPNCLVAIGMHLDTAAVRARLDSALRPGIDSPTLADSHRLRRYRQRSA